MTKYTNPMIIKKDTSPYLYLTDFSGIYFNKYPTVNHGARILVNETLSDIHYLVSLQVWFRYPKETFTSPKPLVSINYDGGSVVFTVTPMSDPTKARVTVNVPAALHKNGNFCSSYIIHAGEWNSLYAIFEDSIDFAAFSGNIVLHPEFVFNNIAQYIYENPIETIVVTTPLPWELIEQTGLISNTWQNILSRGAWEEATADLAIESSYTLSGDYIYGNQIGTSVIVNDDVSTISTYSNGIDVYANVEWQRIEKTLV